MQYNIITFSAFSISLNDKLYKCVIFYAKYIIILNDRFINL